MPISWDKRNKAWRFRFSRVIDGKRYRSSRVLPQAWCRTEADAYDRTESARLYAIATGVTQADPLISDAVMAYLEDKGELKSFKATAEHLASIAWAFDGRRMSELARVAAEITSHEAERGCKPATIRNRLACLKAACRHAWKVRHMVDLDPTTRMVLPTVRNSRTSKATRAQMLTICRACTNWSAQIAIRVGFYTGMRLSEQLQARAEDGCFVLDDSKNGEPRVIPAHHRIRHLLKFYPLAVPKITIQRAWERARDKVGLTELHLHDLRHSTASELVTAGVDLYTVGQLLGHKDPRSTKRYAHLATHALASAVEKIGAKR